MRTLKINTPADLPTAACAVVGFIPTDSIVVLGFEGVPLSARFDLNDDCLAGAGEVIPLYQKHNVLTVALVAFAENTDEARARLFSVTAAFIGEGFTVVESALADGRQVHGEFGSLPYVLDPELVPVHQTRDEFAAANGYDPSDGITVGTEPPTR